MKRNKFPALRIVGIIFGACALICGYSALTVTRGPYEIDSAIRNAEKNEAPERADVRPVDVDPLCVAGAGAGAQVKDYEGFRVSFNAANRTPDWVAWELLGTETEGPVPRARKFWQDTAIDGCPETADYTRSGYDRGHLCPAADQKWSPQAMEDCFSLANVAPQAHALNAGAWKTLEDKERSWARRDSALIIVAGPIYSPSDTIRIGDNRVRVPGAFFKVIAAPWLAEPCGIAFIYPNMSAPGNMQNYSMTIREAERLTGLDFLSEFPKELQDKIETTASFRIWDRR